MPVNLSPADLRPELARYHLAVHQPDDAPLLTHEPVTAVQPCLWRWSDIEPCMRRVAEAVSLDPGGNRRTLRLVNPGLPWGTTHTLWGGIQQVLPGEVATAHRHTPNAFRFIIQGSGASTTVDGQAYRMEPGDVLLTPNWCWHDHVNDGTETAYWLDGLDIPLVRAMNAMFFAEYSKPRQDVLASPDRGPCVFKWADSLAALDRLQPGEPLEFPGLQTIGLAMQCLPAGFRVRERRACSALFQVVRGSGSSQVGSQRFHWNERDFMAVPPWTWLEHEAAEDAILFQMNDAPALKALGLYRREPSHRAHATISLMGLTTLEVEVANPAKPESTERLEFLIDSGATYSVVPAPILQRLRITPVKEQEFRLADGSKIVRKRGGATFKRGEEVGFADVIFGEEGDSQLLGVTALESMGFVLDPIKRELRPLPMILG